jgi:peptide/nickel transport system permease protein
LAPVLVAGAFAVASGVLVESALSFLGFGIAHPIPSWGALVSESHSAQHWWLQLFPGLLIFVTVVAYNLLGESLRDALDPRFEEGSR